MDIEITAGSDNDLGELTVLDMDELHVGGSPTAYSYHAKSADHQAGTQQG